MPFGRKGDVREKRIPPSDESNGGIHGGIHGRGWDAFAASFVS